MVILNQRKEEFHVFNNAPQWSVCSRNANFKHQIANKKVFIAMLMSGI